LEIASGGKTGDLARHDFEPYPID